MTDTQAEEVDSGITFDDEVDNAISEDANEDSAPQKDESPEAETPEGTETEAKPEKHSDKFQDRINKVTADKYKEQRRAEEAERKLAEMQDKLPESQPKPEPKIEDFDFDEAAHQNALIDWKVDQKVNQKADSILEQQQVKQTKQSQADDQRKFIEKSSKFAKEKTDFNEVLGRVPTLQPGVLEVVMQADNGPELAYFLGSHLDIADKIVQMNPVRAGVEIGKISARLAAPKQIKPSGAPEPIVPLPSDGAITKQERGPKDATYE